MFPLCQCTLLCLHLLPCQWAAAWTSTYLILLRSYLKAMLHQGSKLRALPGMSHKACGRVASCRIGTLLQCRLPGYLRHIRQKVLVVISRRCKWRQSNRSLETGSHHRSLSGSPSQIHLHSTYQSHTCPKVQGRHSRKLYSCVCTSQGPKGS